MPLAQTERLLKLNRHDEALGIVDTALKTEPHARELHELRARIVAERDRFRQEQEFEAVIAQAEQLLQSGKAAAAVTLLERALGNYTEDVRLTGLLLRARKESSIGDIPPKAAAERRHGAEIIGLDALKRHFRKLFAP
jgi:predicted Zn-dependent protease